MEASRNKPHDPYIGYYGTEGILKAFCPDCRSTSFVIEDKFSCCDRDFELDPNTVLESRQESQCPGHRKQPTTRRKKQALFYQDDKCFYCDKPFGLPVMYYNRLTFLRVCWDHVKPFAYMQDNPDDNFVAACQFCNGWKSSRIFPSLDEARRYLQTKWKTKIEKNVLTV